MLLITFFIDLLHLHWKEYEVNQSFALWFEINLPLAVN